MTPSLKPGVSIMGMAAAQNSQCRVGKLTFSPASGTAADNYVSIGNVQIDSGINTPCVVLAGTAPMTVRMSNLTVRRDNGSAPLMQVANSQPTSTVLMNNCMIRNEGTSTGLAIRSGIASMRVNSSIISKAGIECIGGALQLSHCQVEYLNLSQTDSLTVTAGQMMVSHSLVRNAGIGANGAVIADGAALAFISSIWDLADLTGYVAMGEGNLVVDRWTFASFPGNVRNTNVQDTVNILQMADSPTIIS